MGKREVDGGKARFRSLGFRSLGFVRFRLKGFRVVEFRGLRLKIVERSLDS
jgi:hypothetical protein